MVRHRIRKRTGKELLFQPNLTRTIRHRRASQSESRSVLGYSECRGCLLASLPRPCRLPLARSALLYIHRWMMTSMWAKVSLYIHNFPKRNRAHTCLFFLVPISESVLLGVGSPPTENRILFEGGKGKRRSKRVHNISKRGIGGACQCTGPLGRLLYTALLEKRDTPHHTTPGLTPLHPFLSFFSSSPVPVRGTRT